MAIFNDSTDQVRRLYLENELSHFAPLHDHVVGGDPLAKTKWQIGWLWRTSRAKRAAAGLVLAAGAPIGWLVILSLFSHDLRASLARDAGVLLYMWLGTSIVFALFGAYVGWHEELASKRALQDPLTGIPNRGFFNLRLEQLISLARRSGPSDFKFSLVFFDIDHFKQINDRYGHHAGDRVLAQLATVASRQLRASEALARVGGEEFAILVEGDELTAAMALAERVRVAIASSEFLTASGEVIPVTASFGVAEFCQHTSAEALFQDADRAMYRAKSGGRNRVCSS